MLVLASAALGGAYASIARADGDPASDYLLSRQVFLSAQSTGSSASGRALISAVEAANRAGFKVRVAVIPSSYDLGSVVPLWRKPQAYAHFLGVELSLVYGGRLIVVMPNGFGFNWQGHSYSAADARLARVATGSDAGQLYLAAQTAVRKLAAADGVTIGATGGAASSAGASHDGGLSAVIVALAAVLVVVVLGLLLVPRLRRRTGGRPWLARRRDAAVAGVASAIRRLRPDRAAAAPVDVAAASPAWSRRRLLVVPGLALVSAAAAGVLLAVALHPTVPDVSSAAAAEGGPAAEWPAGRQVAPTFRLIDQNGRPVSLAAYRGRPVIVTFIDPLCRNLCPLEAHVLNAMDRQLPAAKRTPILAVSVNVYADARPNLLQDYSKWSLVPQWRWAVGPASVLAAVWKDYKIEVIDDTKRIAGTTVHEISHIEGAYVIDGTGHVRALFLWPFTPQDVETTLQSLG